MFPIEAEGPAHDNGRPRSRTAVGGNCLVR
jgi:hypothetical protein